MGRPRKKTVDYFPHFVSTDSKTRFILEDRWGNDGYAFWFKLLELLGRSEGHYYDCSESSGEQYLYSLAKVSAEMGEEILEALASFNDIDRELWEEHRIIWCQNLVDNLQDVYAKRSSKAPTKPFSEPKQIEEPEKQPDKEVKKTSKKENAKEQKSVETTIDTVSKGDTQRVLEAWNELSSCGINQVQKITSGSKRQKNLNARIKEYGIDNVLTAIARIRKSKFLQGYNNRNWTITFDWFLLPNNFCKVHDGNYDEKTGVTHGSELEDYGARLGRWAENE